MTSVTWESFMIGLFQGGFLRRGQFLNQKITNNPTDPENLHSHCAGIVKIKIGDLLESGKGAFNETCLKADEMKQLFKDEKFWVKPAQAKIMKAKKKVNDETVRHKKRRNKSIEATLSELNGPTSKTNRVSMSPVKTS
jgi:hypothetical protein